MAINWEEAPEGTTHGTEDRGAIYSYGPWRKIEDRVYYYRGGEWVDQNAFSVDVYLRANTHVVARPVPVEAALPNGLKWPEGFNHYNPRHGGFFFNVGCWRGKDNPARGSRFAIGAYETWVGIEGTISRYGKGVNPVQKQPVEAPKKKVGWW